MSEFVKYCSIERLGNQYGYTNDWCYLFSKLDGCNGSASGRIDAQLIDTYSRNGPIDYDDPSIAIGRYLDKNPALKKFIIDNPNYVVYGEFMRKQEIRYYDKSAWSNFYVFDVLDRSTGRYIHYDVYSQWFNELGIAYIPCIAQLYAPTVEAIAEYFDKADFCLQDKGGAPEGIVIKNYNYVRRDGKQKWERLITSEFRKAKGHKAMDMRSIESKIVDEYCTDAQIGKNFQRSITKDGTIKEINDVLVTQIYHRVYHDIINEDIWQVIIKHKDPTINFFTLKKLIEANVKQWIEKRKSEIEDGKS